jgi:XTP/dITP diphosphohydrolase
MGFVLKEVLSMKEICFVSSNKGKIQTMERVCLRHDIAVKPLSVELREPQSLDLREIAKEKVEQAYSIVRRPVVVQDSGFYLDEWPGYPGPFVKFITTKSYGNDMLLALVNGRNRACEFCECLAFTDETRKVRFFESVIRGSLAFEEEKDMPDRAWSPLWKIFIPYGQTKTIAGMSDEERALWRKTRGNQSAEKFAEWYSTQ